MKYLFFIFVITLVGCLSMQDPYCVSGDCANGYGTSDASGHKYVGEWKDGKYHGKGTSTTPRGLKYVGDFENGLENGQGTMTYPGGGSYSGGWKDGEYHGKGTLISPDGRKLVVEFVDGKANGNGIEYDAKGKVVRKGRWENGKPVNK